MVYCTSSSASFDKQSGTQGHDDDASSRSTLWLRQEMTISQLLRMRMTWSALACYKSSIATWRYNATSSCSPYKPAVRGSRRRNERRVLLPPWSFARKIINSSVPWRYQKWMFTMGNSKLTNRRQWPARICVRGKSLVDCTVDNKTARWISNHQFAHTKIL